jgi:hypothetical protein
MPMLMSTLATVRKEPDLNRSGCQAVQRFADVSSTPTGSTFHKQRLRKSSIDASQQALSDAHHIPFVTNQPALTTCSPNTFSNG